jgi:hypothetical protein
MLDFMRIIFLFANNIFSEWKILAEQIKIELLNIMALPNQIS